MAKIKKRFKKYLPDLKKLQEYKALRIFGDLLHDPNLWHFNRYSVATAFSVGLFFAWIPVPFQMALAAGGAMLFHANLPLSVALVWITNPLTMPPLFYFAYRVGAMILDITPKKFHFELSWDWLLGQLHGWKPLLIGCVLLAIVSAILANIIIRGIWRYLIIRHWNARKLRIPN